MFVDTHENIEPLRIILDERMFADTVLRAIKISPDVFIVCDIRLLNGTNLFEKLPFVDRKNKLEELLDTFHHPDFVGLFLPEQAPHGIIVRGKEYYDDQPGTLGVFLPANE
jgi:hypothetical protein